MNRVTNQRADPRQTANAAGDSVQAYGSDNLGTIGHRMAYLREKRGESQESLATKINVTRTTLAKWESGEIDLPIRMAVRLAQLFDISFDWLLTGRVPQQGKSTSKDK